VNLARALLRRPSLLLLDEPTSALDPDAQEAVLASLRDMRGTTTIVIATHRADLLPVDRLIVLGG
jgi:ABC-type bacteriocin/lantibiotic exporter with double-glycine peptidase domain